VFWFAFCVFQVLNPQLPSVWVGVLGLATYFQFVPMSYLVSASFGSLDGLTGFLRRYAILSLPLSALAVVQFVSPRTSWLNRSVLDLGDRPAVLIEDVFYARVASTFSTYAGYAQYLWFIMLIVAFLVSDREAPPWKRGAWSVVLAIAFVSICMTATRGSILPAVGGVLLYVVLVSAMYRSMSPLRYVGIGVGIAVLLIGWTQVGRLAWTASLTRTLGAEDIVPRIREMLTPWRYLKHAGFTGTGIGSTYQGSRALLAGMLQHPTPRLDIPASIEREPERVMLELGPVGYGLVYLVRVVLFAYAVRVATRAREVRRRAMALAVVLFQVPALHLNQVIYQHVLAKLYWFSVGMVFVIAREEGLDLIGRPGHRYHPVDADLPSSCRSRVR
jgi:hypothetical protein